MPVRKRAQDLPTAAGLVSAVSEAASENADCWFPDLDAGRVRARLLAVDARPRCFLYRLELDDGRLQRPVVVKVRHSRADLRRLDKFDGRPVLTPERTMPDHETAKLEYDALRMIGDAVGHLDDSRFGVLRSLAWLPEHSAIVMDLAVEPTLRQRLLETSRLHRRPRRTGPPDLAAWSNAGAWLRVFHDHESDLPVTVRNATPAEAVDLIRGYADFLTAHVGASTVLSHLRDSADEVVDAALPPELPLRRSHGDFVANNMFAAASGRITVFDPLPKWSVPPYQDLATLVVGIRVLPLQATTQGLALSQAALGHYESALLGGYFGPERVPWPAVRAFQLLVLLDKWSAMVGKRTPHGRVRPQLHELRVRAASRHFHREARRLFSMLPASPR